MIKETFHKLKDIWTDIKIYLQRAMSYLIILNSIMLMFLFLDKLKEMGLEFSFKKYYVPMCIVFIILLIFVGYLDTKLGFFKEEAKRAASRNPYFTETLENVKQINERLEKIENSLCKSDKAGEETDSGTGE